MDVYLVRHGHAVDSAVDPARPLSRKGQDEVRTVAGYLARLERAAIPRQITDIHHSGKARAEQTARILGDALAGHAPVAVSGGLAPNDDPRIVAERLQGARDEDRAIMLVGHLPHLERLIGLLLCGDSNAGPARLTTAAVAALSWQGRDGWALDWLLADGLLPTKSD
jgi:phosphohistidine phosphatase